MNAHKLDKNLNEWVSHGLISEEQAYSISAREKTQRRKGWSLRGFAISAASVVAIGSTRIAASSWDFIPAGAKIGAGLAALALLTITALIARGRLLRSAYQSVTARLEAGGLRFTRRLAPITVGLTKLTKTYFFPLTGGIGFFVGVAMTALHSPLFQPIFQSNWIPLAMTLPILGGFLTLSFSKLERGRSLTRAFAWLTGFMGIAALFAVELASETHHGRAFDLIAYFPGYNLALVTILGFWFGTRDQSARFKTFAMFGFLLFLVPFHLPIFGVDSALVYSAIGMALLSILTLALAKLGRHPAYHLVLVTLGIRVALLYAQILEKTLSSGGLGFSFGVSAIIILAAFVYRYYRKSKGATGGPSSLKGEGETTH